MICKTLGCEEKIRAKGLCMECYQKMWIAKRKADWFADKCCVICGSTEDLELDHIDPNTKNLKRIGDIIWHWSEERRNAELAKCQVLCEVCHKEKSAKHRDGMKARGTSKFLGVSWDARSNMWHARIQIKGKGRHIGYFHTEIEAAKAYDSTMIKEYGEGCFQNINIKE